MPNYFIQYVFLILIILALVMIANRLRLAYPFDDGRESSVGKYQAVYLKLLERQRSMLEKMNHSAEFDEELIRKYPALIDLEEFKIREKFYPTQYRNSD